MVSTEFPAITVEFGESRGTRSFHSAEEIRGWLDQESAVWEWLQHSLEMPLELRNELTGFRSALESCRQRLVEMAATNPKATQERRRELAAAIAAVLKETYASKRAPLSSDAEGRLLLESARRSGYAALGTYMGLRKTRLTREAALAEGLIQAHLLRVGQGQAAELHSAALEELLGDFRGRFDRALSDFGTVAAMDVEQHNNVLTFAVAVQQERKEAFDTQLSLQQGQYTEMFDAAKEALEKLQNVYNEQLALRVPVQYWRSKRLMHRWWVAGLAVATTAGGAGVLVTLHRMLEDLLTPASGGSSAGGSPSPASVAGQPPLWEMGFLVVVALVLLWGVRLLVRGLLSQMHLASDASQRIVLTQTYLALVHGGHVSDASDRSLILKALFRPTATGIIRDDAIPPTPAGELFDRATGRP